MKKTLKRIATIVCIMSLICIPTSAYASTTNMYCEKCGTVKTWNVSCTTGVGTYVSSRMHDINSEYELDPCHYDVYYNQYIYSCSCGNTRLGSVHPCYENHYGNHGVGVVKYHN